MHVPVAGTCLTVAIFITQSTCEEAHVTDVDEQDSGTEANS